MIKNISLTIILLFVTTITFASNLSCFDTGGFNEGGDPWCAVVCPNEDGTAEMFIISCDSDYFEIYN